MFEPLRNDVLVELIPQKAKPSLIIKPDEDSVTKYTDFVNHPLQAKVVAISRRIEDVGDIAVGDVVAYKDGFGEIYREKDKTYHVFNESAILGIIHK